jgi:hypothetical protein
MLLDHTSDEPFQPLAIAPHLALDFCVGRVTPRSSASRFITLIASRR